MEEGAGRKRLDAGFRIGEWLVEPTLNRISRGDDRSTLEPKVMDVLVYLASRQGETITKDDFFETVWEGVILTDDALSRCISELRKNLEDDSRNPRYIETIRKTGYRLISPVEHKAELDAAAEAMAATPGPKWVEPEEGSRTVGLWVIAVVGVAALIGLAFVVLARFDTDSSPADANAAPVTLPYTSFEGLEIQPSFSPDGRVVAFSARNDRERNFDIYLKQEGSETPFRLTQNPADDLYPAWSPDGQVIAFVRLGDESNTVYTIPSLGGQERLIVDFGFRKVAALSWSPEGDKLAVSAQGAPFESYVIHLVDLDSTSIQPLTNPPRYDFGDTNPAFSPDGSRLAFVRGVTDDLEDVFVITFAEEGLRQVTFDSVAVSGIAWLPGGNGIVISSQRGDPSGLWQVDLNGGEPRMLNSAVPGRRYENPSVAADGRRLVYADRSSNMNIWRAFKPQGFQSLRSRPVVFSTYTDSHPDISPDGTRIAFHSSQSGYDEIWISDADGSNPSKLTSSLASATAPRWSPDGKWIAFQGRDEGQSDIFLIDPQGGAPRRVTASPGEDTLPQWSRDGKAIYFSSNRSGRWELWRSTLDEQEDVQITIGGGRFGMESHDGQSFYFVKPDTLGIWKAPLETPDEHVLVFDQLDSSDWANWTVRESGIYFVQRLSYAPALSFYFFDSKNIVRLVTLDNVPDQPALTAARDFSWFAYTQIDDDGGDLMMLEGF